LLTYNSLEEVPSTNPDNNSEWVTGARIQIKGVEHIYNALNGKWQPMASADGTRNTQDSTGSDSTPDDSSESVLFDNQPPIIWEEQKIGRPGSAPSVKTSKKNWFDATNYLTKLKTSNVKEYNKWVKAIVASNFYEGGNITDAKVNSAFKEALIGAATNQRSIQSVLFNVDSKGELPLGVGIDTTGVSKANQLENYKRLVKRYAVQQGVDITDAKVSELASQALAKSWDSPTISENVSRSGVITGEKGNVAGYIDKLKIEARNYGVSYNDLWFDQAAASVVQGYSSIEDYQSQIKNYSKQIYPAFAKQIDSGVTPYAIASPYINTMANILEVNPNDITLNDPTISMALKNVDAEGTPSVKPLWQFEKDLRQDSRWRFTKNAQQDLMGTARKVLSDFGLVS
jgi:hypothetical protein